MSHKVSYLCPPPPRRPPHTSSPYPPSGGPPWSQGVPPWRGRRSSEGGTAFISASLRSLSQHLCGTCIYPSVSMVSISASVRRLSLRHLRRQSQRPYGVYPSIPMVSIPASLQRLPDHERLYGVRQSVLTTSISAS